MAPDELEPPYMDADFDHEMAVAAILARIAECAKPGFIIQTPLPDEIGPVIGYLEEQWSPDWHGARDEAVWLKCQCAAALHHHGVQVPGYYPGIHTLNEAEDPEGWELSLMLTVGALTVEQVFAAFMVYRDVVMELDRREAADA
jgi:hypothetical protein